MIAKAEKAAAKYNTKIDIKVQIVILVLVCQKPASVAMSKQ